MQDNAVLEIKDLSVGYNTERGMATAVQDVNLTIRSMEVVGIVGESGCGKSTMANAVMRLLPPGAYVTQGTISLNGQDIYKLQGEELRRFRWKEMSMVFQGAMNVLNPVKTIESQFIDMLMAHIDGMKKVNARQRAKELFRLVRIDEKRLRSFPHELSGGMRQRVVIAMAIALNPKLIILDEPTTALDVVVQRSILSQILQLKEQFGFSILFISHDFNLVAEISDRVGVMYAGRLIELAKSSGKWENSLHHPYTTGLIRAVPKLDVDTQDELKGIPGSLPNLLSLPNGCQFHPRCPFVQSVCLAQKPIVKVLGDVSIECHLSADELRSMTYV